MGACNPFRNKRRCEPPSWAAPFSPGEEGLQNSLEPSGHVLSPGEEGVHPEKHFNMPESASFLAKKKEKNYGTPGEISVRLSEGLPETVKSGPWGRRRIP